MTLLLAIALFLVCDFLYFNWLSRKPGFKSGSLSFAKFTPGAIVSEVRNKIAATVYTKNKAGASIRNRTTPINRRSVGQTGQRQQLASFSSNWRGLTQAQRDGWNSAAASFPQQDNLGQTIFLTGAQLYVRCNLNLLLIGAAQIDDAPSPTSFPVLALGTIVSDASSGTLSVPFTPDPVPAGYQLVFRATAPISQGKSFIGQSAFRFIDSAAPAATSPKNLAAAYIAVFGAITSKAGQKIFVEAFFVEIASGLAGIPVRGFVIIVP